MTKSVDKLITCATAGGILTVVELIFGRIDYSMIFLFIVMCADFLTGVMTGYKSKTLSSKICTDGLFRKFMILIYVMIGHHLDVLLHVEYIRMGVCYMYATGEVLSIFENGVKLGVPIPEPIKKALDILNNKGETSNEN